MIELIKVAYVIFCLIACMGLGLLIGRLLNGSWKGDPDSFGDGTNLIDW